MNLLGESFRYLMVTTLAFVVDYSLLFFLAEILGIYYLAAVIVSFVVGMTFHYGMCVWWVFGRRRLKNRKNEFLVFCIIGGLGLLLNTGVVALLVESLALYVMWAKLVASALTLIFNFSLRKIILFYIPDGHLSLRQE